MNFPLTVLIATSGQRPDLLRRTLASLAESEMPGGYVETVVIENGSRGATSDIVAEFEATLDVRYIFVDRANKSHALNCALDSVVDGLILFHDDDIRLADDYLHCYQQAADTNGPGHYFGGPVICDYDVAPPDWLKPLLPNSARDWTPSTQAEATKSPFLGCNWAAFYADIRANGGFDTNYGPGSPTNSVGQETNMQRRLKDGGAAPIYLPEARVWHYVPESRCNWQWSRQRARKAGAQNILDRADSRVVLRTAGYTASKVTSIVKHLTIGLLTLSRSRLGLAIRQLDKISGALEGLKIIRQQRQK